jgi:hypothetical protein
MVGRSSHRRRLRLRLRSGIHGGLRNSGITSLLCAPPEKPKPQRGENRAAGDRANHGARDPSLAAAGLFLCDWGCGGWHGVRGNRGGRGGSGAWIWACWLMGEVHCEKSVELRLTRRRNCSRSSSGRSNHSTRRGGIRVTDDYRIVQNVFAAENVILGLVI